MAGIIKLMVIDRDPADTHVCFDDVAEGGDLFAAKCERFSSTGLTCYPSLDNRIGSKRCYSGWEPIQKSDPLLVEAKNGFICTYSGCRPK